jgi:Na+/H+ antiporter NhaA
LAFSDTELLSTARLAIIIGSFLSATVGLVVLYQVNNFKIRDKNSV